MVCEKYYQLLKKLSGKSKCTNCECLRGFIEQILSDFKGEERSELEALKCDISKMHPCLDCRDCLPAKEFTNYLKLK